MNKNEIKKELLNYLINQKNWINPITPTSDKLTNSYWKGKNFLIKDLIKKIKETQLKELKQYLQGELNLIEEIRWLINNLEKQNIIDEEKIKKEVKWGDF